MDIVYLHQCLQQKKDRTEIIVISSCPFFNLLHIYIGCHRIYVIARANLIYSLLCLFPCAKCRKANPCRGIA